MPLDNSLPSVIFNFRCKYRPFSNHHLKPCELDGETYPNIENAFQAAKTLNYDERKFFQTCTSAASKHRGKMLDLRSDWESVKHSIMLDLVRQKFCDGDEKQLLLSTLDCELIEGNYWHDNYWGKCYGPQFNLSPAINLSCDQCKQADSHNHLGRLLMQVRQELQPAA